MSKMDYIIYELNSKNTILEIREIAKCMRNVQKFNEQDVYENNIEYMGYEGFKIPSQIEYENFLRSATTEEDAKVFVAKEKDRIVGLSVCGLTQPHILEGRQQGRIIFFWISPDYRKTKLNNRLYKKVFGWFNNRNCVSVSLTVKNFQSKIAEFFMN